MKKLKILTVFGTRPEIIKLAPFIKAVEMDADCLSITVATTQQRELQNEFLDLFNLKPDYNLDVMRESQDLFHITISVLTGLKNILDQEEPDFVVVQGDTTTTFTAALAGFYKKIPVVHIEAGLRTGDMYSPFPEEANRSFVSKVATLHMAPTQKAYQNLLNEGISKNIFMVGNTIVDSVAWGLKAFGVKNNFVDDLIHSEKQKILITLHRRESFGDPLENICEAIKNLCQQYQNVHFIWPVHPNPNVKSVVHQRLKNIPNLHLIDPLPYGDLLLLMNACTLILSDSGGIQEEACILGKHIIILRESTERTEIVECGIGVLVGADQQKILSAFQKMIHDSSQYKGSDVYGFPGVSENILNIIKSFYRSCH